MKQTIQIIKYLFSKEGDIEAKTLFKVMFIQMTVSLISFGFMCCAFLKYY